MAREVVIQKKDGITEIYIDGTEIQDVVSYELSENHDVATLKIELCVIGNIACG